MNKRRRYTQKKIHKRELNKSKRKNENSKKKTHSEKEKTL